MSDNLVILGLGFHSSNTVAFWDRLLVWPGTLRIRGPYELCKGRSVGIEKFDALEVWAKVDEHADTNGNKGIL